MKLSLKKVFTEIANDYDEVGVSKSTYGQPGYQKPLYPVGEESLGPSVEELGKQLQAIHQKFQQTKDPRLAQEMMKLLQKIATGPGPR